MTNAEADPIRPQSMLRQLVLPEVIELLQAGQFEVLGDVLGGWHPADLASVLRPLDEQSQLRLLTTLSPAVRASAFGYLGIDLQRALLASMSDTDAALILDEMAPDDRTALFAELSPDTTARLMALLSPEQRSVAETLLEYGEQTIGRLMTPDYVAVRMDWTVQHVLDHVRTHGTDRETLNVVYVVDEANKLIDDIRIREFLLAPLNHTVRQITDGHFVTLRATDDRKSAVEVFKKYDRTALPVVDSVGTLVGIVTVDDVIDLAEEAATRELQQFGGLEALDTPYRTTSVVEMVKKRAVWLVILFLGEMFTATAMGFFEAEIERAVVLALFVPLIISSGGNSGSQAATLIIRALALHEIELTDWWLVFRRELASGLLLGAILGVIGFLRIAIWSGFTTIYGPFWRLVGVTVGMSLVGIVLWGTLAGSMLPFLLKRLGFDPATSSAPFVATLVDVTGLVIYFTVAMVVLRGTIL